MFLEAATGANTLPICTFALVRMCLCVFRGGSEKEMLSSISLGAPLLSCHHSLALGTQHSCRGTTLQGTFVSICLQFTVAPI